MKTALKLSSAGKQLVPAANRVMHSKIQTQVKTEFTSKNTPASYPAKLQVQIHNSRQMINQRKVLENIALNNTKVTRIAGFIGHIIQLFKIPADLRAFGNANNPRPPRSGKDIAVDNNGDVTKTNPPTGASTFGDVSKAPLSGHYHKVSKNTDLPDGLNVIADGNDVGGHHGATHHTIFPEVKMSFINFAAKFLAIPWIYEGKK